MVMQEEQLHFKHESLFCPISSKPKMHLKKANISTFL